MIDISNLDKKVDELIESQTTDDILNWLFKRRMVKTSQLMGEGKFVSLTSNNIPFAFVGNDSSENFCTENSEIDDGGYLPRAA